MCLLICLYLWQQNIMSDFDWSSIDDIDFNFDEDDLAVVQQAFIVASMAAPVVPVEGHALADSNGFTVSENVAHSEVLNQLPDNGVAVSDKACGQEQHDDGMGSLEEIHVGFPLSLFGAI